MQEFEMEHLPIGLISFSETNPRETYDEAALAELALSIGQVGVLQPILVRPKNGAYELVYGERRYRASRIAQKQTIPCMVRELTDDEVFEIQIIENLQRADIHPLDEAKAFKKMLDSGKYSMHDIACKVGKEESFIAQRLKLNDLLPEIKQDFFNGELPIGHAVLIARLNEEQQLSIYKDHKNNYSIQGYGSYKQLQQVVNQKSIELKNVPFSLDNVFAHAGPCNTCATRSKSNPVLFADMQAIDSCFNRTCYNAKLDAHTLQEMESVLATGNVILAKSHSDVPAEQITTLATQYDVPILQSHDHFFLKDTPGTEKRKVLYTTGTDRGKYGDVWVKKEVLEANPVDADVAAQIKKIEAKAVRALELDAEKVHTGIIEALQTAFDTKQPQNITFTDDFVTGMLLYMAIESDLYGLRDRLKPLGIELQGRYWNVDDILADMAKITDEQKRQLLALLMFRKYRSSTGRKSLDGHLLLHIAHSIPEIPVAAIEAAQQAKADKRIGNTQKAIADLKTPKKKSALEKAGAAISALISSKK